MGQSSPEELRATSREGSKVREARSLSRGCGQITPSIQDKVRDTVFILITAVPKGHLQREPV